MSRFFTASLLSYSKTVERLCKEWALFGTENLCRISSAMHLFFSVGVVCYVFLLHSCRLLCLSAPLVSSATYFCSVRIVCYVRIFCPLVSSAPSEESPARQMEWWPSMAHFRTVPVMACALSLYFDRRGRKRKRENLSIRAFSPNSVAGTSLLLL